MDRKFVLQFGGGRVCSSWQESREKEKELVNSFEGIKNVQFWVNFEKLHWLLEVGAGVMKGVLTGHTDKGVI